MASKVASNDDLLEEILLRLPVKPLLRFKCVSKHWLSLVSEPRFCHSHTLRQYQTPRPFPSALLLATSPSSSRCPIIPLKTSDANSSSKFRYLKLPGMIITIMQSCNGLLLIEGRPLQSPFHPLLAKHYVHNPTTNKFSPLTFPNRQFGSSVLALFLSFEPLRSPHYKVVSLRHKDVSSLIAMMSLDQNKEIDYILNVYSSETGSWSHRGIRFSVPNFRSAVYCNGSIYWYHDNVTKCFDVETQRFKPFPLPVIDEDKVVLYFGESGGRLHVVVKSHRNLEIGILELKQDGSEWFVRYRVNLSPIKVAFPQLVLEFAHMDGSFYIFCVVHQEKEEDSMLVFFVCGRVMAYNLASGSFRSLGRFDPFVSEGSRCNVFHYYENLACVRSSIA